MTGPNVLVNPTFANGLTGWGLANPGAPNSISVVDGSALIINAPGGNEPGLVQNVVVSGAPYEAIVSIEVLSGVARMIVGNVIQVLPGSGVWRYLITGTTQPQFYILQQTDGTSRVHWASLRRSDQSMSTVVIGIRDFDGDKPQTSMTLGPVTDGPSYVTREGEAAAVRDAVNAVCGNIWRYQFLAIDTEPNDTNAASQVVQANHRWKVTFVDSVTGDNVFWYIPTADLTVANLLLTGSNQHNPATQAWIDFKTALNGVAINKKTGSTMTITAIEYEE